MNSQPRVVVGSRSGSGTWRFGSASGSIVAVEGGVFTSGGPTF